MGNSEPGDQEGEKSLGRGNSKCKEDPGARQTGTRARMTASQTEGRGRSNESGKTLQGLDYSVENFRLRPKNKKESSN